MHPDIGKGFVPIWDQLFHQAFPQVRGRIDAAERPVEAVQSVIDENLKDCTLIGPDAGRALRAMVYGSALWEGDQA